jgi:TM2 domain-containing membrane protein YozV
VKKFFLFILLASLFASTSFAQEKEKKEEKKTKADTSLVAHRANRAALFSAILPGAGQFYNKKYWKLPILYGGITVLALSATFNDKYYQKFKTAYQYRVDTLASTVDEYVTIYPDADALLLRRDYYRRTRDLMYIIGGVVYVLNIIDAYVDAHLANFDISDNLSMRAGPTLELNYAYQPVGLIRLSINLH